MKASKVFLLLIIAVSLTYSTSVNAQKKAKKVTTSITLEDDYGVDHTFTGNGIEVYNAISGNYLRTVHIKIPLDILELYTFEPYANYLFAGYIFVDIDEDGIDDFWVVDYSIYINKSGNMSVSFHYNGAGNVIPRKYYLIIKL